MSGATVAYHLRLNKSVERQLFVDLLGRLAALWPIASYKYISMGGPFLEDFRVMHWALGIQDMVSIDMDEETVARQKFNLPTAAVVPIVKTSGRFITDFVRTGPVIIWLDYTDPRKRRDQLEEFQALLPKLEPGDIVRVTLNASADTLHPDHGLRPEEYKAKRWQALQKQLGTDFLPVDADQEDTIAATFPALLHRTLELAARRTMRSRDDHFVNLASFSYREPTHMLVLTAAIATTTQVESIGRILDTWPFRCKDRPEKIDIPVLSARERLVIDSRLPTEGLEGIRAELNYFPEEQIEAYIRFYRHVPFFSRVLL